MESCADVSQLRVPEESPDDPGTHLEALQSIDRDCLELISGQRHGPRDPVVLDVLVDPFIGVQLGRIGRKEEQLQSPLRARDVVFNDPCLVNRGAVDHQEDGGVEIVEQAGEELG